MVPLYSSEGNSVSIGYSDHPSAAEVIQMAVECSATVEEAGVTRYRVKLLPLVPLQLFTMEELVAQLGS